VATKTLPFWVSLSSGEMMMLAFKPYFILLCTCVLASPLFSAEVVAMSGTAKVRKAGGAPSALTLKARLGGGDLVITGDEGFVKIKMRDESVITVQSSSRYLISEDADPSDKSGSKSMLVSGSANFDLSKIKKLYVNKDEAYKVYTPTSVCGVRGTQFQIVSDKNGKSQTKVTEGEVAASGDTLNDDARVTGGQSIAKGSGYSSDKGGKVTKGDVKLPSSADIKKELSGKPKPDADYEKYYVDLVKELAGKIVRMKEAYDQKGKDALALVEEAKKAIASGDQKKGDTLLEKNRIVGLERFILGKDTLHRINEYRGYLTLLENSSVTLSENKLIESIFSEISH
jgi:hypothetical protein